MVMTDKDEHRLAQWLGVLQKIKQAYNLQLTQVVLSQDDLHHLCDMPVFNPTVPVLTEDVWMCNKCEKRYTVRVETDRNGVTYYSWVLR